MRFVLILKSRSLPQSATADSSLSEGALDKYRSFAHSHNTPINPNLSHKCHYRGIYKQNSSKQTSSLPVGASPPDKSQFIAQIPLSWYLQSKFAKKHRLLPAEATRLGASPQRHLLHKNQTLCGSAFRGLRIERNLSKNCFPLVLFPLTNRSVYSIINILCLANAEDSDVVI